MSEKTCFVVQGFGTKTDFQTGKSYDLDKSYKMIKRGVEAAGVTCIRADEIQHSGTIDKPMFERLLNADLVVADLTTGNLNAYYELGIRHALRPFTTIVVAARPEEGQQFPFDVSHVVIRQYHHLGEGIDFEEYEKFSGDLQQAVQEILERSDPDSPVYTFFPALQHPMLGKAIAESDRVADGEDESADTDDTTVRALMDKAAAAKSDGDFLKAKSLLEVVHEQVPQEPFVLQQWALVTYKSEYPSAVEALEEARGKLSTLKPDTSNDTETLGIWGAIHKRLWEHTGDRPHLDTAIRSYLRGFYLRNDYYNGINYAYLLNVRAAEASEPAEAIADWVQAERVRREVVDICLAWLDKAKGDDEYWIRATLWEAYYGLGEEDQVTRWEQEARDAEVTQKWMLESTEQQIEKLTALLAADPTGALDR